MLCRGQKESALPHPRKDACRRYTRSSSSNRRHRYRTRRHRSTRYSALSPTFVLPSLQVPTPQEPGPLPACLRETSSAQQNSARVFLAIASLLESKISRAKSRHARLITLVLLHATWKRALRHTRGLVMD